MENTLCYISPEVYKLSRKEGAWEEAGDTSPRPKIPLKGA